MPSTQLFMDRVRSPVPGARSVVRLYWEDPTIRQTDNRIYSDRRNLRARVYFAAR
jgi:hypothetical protein